MAFTSLQILPAIYQSAVVVMFSAIMATEQGPRPGTPRPDRVANCVDEPYWGIVTDITKNSISIQFAKDKAKCFQVSETLAAGKIPMAPRIIPGTPQAYRVSPIKMYRLTDVKVGDWVDISYAHLDGVNICDHICIKKRPGGFIPPLPDEAEELRKPSPRAPGRPPPPYFRYDEFNNAYWDLEDKGIPYPEKFGEMRRWPIAPTPREVANPRLAK